MDRRVVRSSLVAILDFFRKILFRLPLPGMGILMLRGNLHRFFACVRAGIRENGWGASVGNFRRSIHRIEKGLSRPDRRSVFALDYIRQTVVTLKVFASDGSDVCDRGTLYWASEVLRRYFAAVDPVPVVREANAIFDTCCDLLPKAFETPFVAPVPYAGGLRPDCAVSYEDLFRLAVRRRSVRKFKATHVDPALLEKAVAVAGLSPSACNRQPYCFRFFSDKEDIALISSIPGGMDDFREGVPCLCIVTIDYSNYFHERDMLTPVMDAGMAIMAFQYALETLGLSSVCVNWPCLPDRDRRGRAAIQLEAWETPVLCLAMGYPVDDALILASVKKEVSMLMRLEGRGNE